MANPETSFYQPKSLIDALAALAERGRDGTALAGATWIMRAPLRHEKRDGSYVAISKLDELRRTDISGKEISIGACVTHADLAEALAPLADCRALAEAAGGSANPAIRHMATIGGNLCAADFAAADLVPALLCLGAEVELETPKGPERMSLERFLDMRRGLEPGCLVRRVIVQRSASRSAHIRLPLRKAGDYPVAIVSLAATLGPGGVVESARVAVGSVEPVARRWRSLEAQLIGRPLDAREAVDSAVDDCGDFNGRDGVEAPGWYRVKVLPSLLRRAIEAIREQA